MFQESIWGIDLGGTCVRVVRLGRRGSGYEITAVDRIDLYQDPLHNRPEELDAALRKALSIFVVNHRIGKRDRVGVCIPGLGFETFTIELPPVAQERVAGLVDYELRKKTGAFGNEMIHAFREMPGPSVNERRILAAAGPAGIAGAYVDALASVGIQADHFTLAPLAMLDAFKGDGVDTRDAICIRAGVGVTDIVSAMRDHLQLRTDPEGTAWISRELRGRFGLAEKEAEGERRLLESAAGNPRFAPLAREYAQRVVKRAASAIEYAKRNNHAFAPQRVLLAGEGARIAALAEELKLQLRLPVEIHAKWNRIAISRQLIGHAMATEVPSLTSALGAALDATGDAADPMSFLPGNRVRQTLRFGPPIALASLVLGAAVFAGDRMVAHSTGKLRDALREMKQTSEKIQKREADSEALRAALDRAGVASLAWNLPAEWLAWERLNRGLFAALGSDANVLACRAKYTKNGTVEAELEFTIPRARDNAAETRPRSQESDLAVMFRARALPDPQILAHRPVAAADSDRPAAENAPFEWFQIRVALAATAAAAEAEGER